MEARGFGEFTALFKKCAVDGERFLALTMEDLVDMGLDNAYVRKQILKEVAKLNGLCSFDCTCNVWVAQCDPRAPRLTIVHPPS